MKAKGLILLVLVAFVGWSVWWLVGSGGQKAALGAWLEDRQRAGWVADTGDISVTGFPARFDTLISDLSIADPASGWAWSGEEFQILSLAYQPNRFILAWPGTHSLSVPGATAEISAHRLRASAHFFPDTDLALEEIILEASDLKAISREGWRAEAERLVVGLRRAEPGTAPDQPYDLGVTGSSVDLPPPLLRRIDPLGVLAGKVDSLTLDATLAFDASWDRHAVEGRKPALTALAIRSSELLWGDLRLSVRGRFHIDATGAPVGEIDVSARNWRRMLKAAAAAGFLPEDLASALETGLSVVAALSGDERTLDVTLSLSDGDMSIGPVPLGPAPRFPPPRPAR